MVRRSAQTRTTEVLSSSIRRNSDQPESAMDRKRCRLRIMPRTDRSSGHEDRPGFRQARGRLVEEVRAPTADAPMQPSQTGSRLGPVARAALRLRQRLRGLEQAPIGEHRKGLETQVDPRHRTFYGLRVIALHLHRKGYIPAVCLATLRCGENAAAKPLCPLLGPHATEARQRYRTQVYPDAAGEPEGIPSSVLAAEAREADATSLLAATRGLCVPPRGLHGRVHAPPPIRRPGVAPLAAPSDGQYLRRGHCGWTGDANIVAGRRARRARTVPAPPSPLP